jgi:GT2 family glycosyltransferase
MIKTSVIIVSFNNQSTIQKCLDSVLKDKTEKEIIVVDNNSEDGTLKILESYKNKIKTIPSNINLGFSKANNLAVKNSIGEYLLFLNPDTKFIENNTLERLLKTLESNPKFGLVGPKLVLPSGKPQKSIRNLPTLSRAFQEYVFGIKNSFNFYLPETETPIDVESIVGACMLIKKETFKKIKGFNEKYFLYFEDLQLCKDIQRIGLRIIYNPSIKVEHAHGVSGLGKNTSKLSIDSARKYHGYLTFSLIELIGRVGNRLRKNEI